MIDINECENNATLCGILKCVNEIGSYRCGCPDGYTGDGYFCNGTLSLFYLFL